MKNHEKLSSENPISLKMCSFWLQIHFRVGINYIGQSVYSNKLKILTSFKPNTGFFLIKRNRVISEGNVLKSKLSCSNTDKACWLVFTFPLENIAVKLHFLHRGRYVWLSSRGKYNTVFFSQWEHFHGRPANKYLLLVCIYYKALLREWVLMETH